MHRGRVPRRPFQDAPCAARPLLRIPRGIPGPPAALPHGPDEQGPPRGRGAEPRQGLDRGHLLQPGVHGHLPQVHDTHRRRGAREPRRLRDVARDVRAIHGRAGLQVRARPRGAARDGRQDLRQLPQARRAHDPLLLLRRRPLRDPRGARREPVGWRGAQGLRRRAGQGGQGHRGPMLRRLPRLGALLVYPRAQGQGGHRARPTRLQAPARARPGRLRAGARGGEARLRQALRDEGDAQGDDAQVPRLLVAQEDRAREGPDGLAQPPVPRQPRLLLPEHRVPRARHGPRARWRPLGLRPHQEAPHRRPGALRPDGGRVRHVLLPHPDGALPRPQAGERPHRRRRAHPPHRHGSRRAHHQEDAHPPLARRHGLLHGARGALGQGPAAAVRAHVRLVHGGRAHLRVLGGQGALRAPRGYQSHLPRTRLQGPSL
mmetsp:Transcript_8958/g.22194  ORF Transcript_8958/g.22194 Transcript_8958/m.22194 type:complete len:431 (-) Transcript_8958:635-1927(-)